TECFSAFIFFFFFQAEDGIRDGHVTGVQTCALPIYRLPGKAFSSLLRRRARRRCVDCRERWQRQAVVGGFANRSIEEKRAPGCRSEERRVGKECRSRWSTDH